MKSFALFTLAMFAIFSLNAQDEKKSEIRVTIEKDGKVVKDTVYMVEEGRSVDHASKILDLTFGEHKSGKKHKVLTFISDDGELHEMHSGDVDMKKMHKMHLECGEMGEEHEMIMKMIHEDDDDMQVFVTKEEGEDGETKVIVKKIKIDKDGGHSFIKKDENVIIMKAGEAGELEHIHHSGEKPVWIEENGAKVLIIDSKDGKQKKIKIVTDSDSDKKFTTEDGNTIIIHTTKDCDNEKEVKVEVIVEDEEGKVEGEKTKVKKTRKK